LLLENLLILSLALLGIALAWFSRRLKEPYSYLGDFICLAAFVLILNETFAGFTKLMVFGFFLIWAGLNVILRLEARRLKVLSTILLVLIFTRSCFMPIFLPWFEEAKHQALVTEINQDGICIQTTGYTCVPSAAVTCLKQLGLKAEVAELTLASRCCSMRGTSMAKMAEVLDEKYPDKTIRFKNLKNLTEIKILPAMVSVEYALLADHAVALLEMDENSVVIGDPLIGRRVYTRKEFKDMWTGGYMSFENKASSVEVQAVH
jgi:predicted double-glycine peptidase